MITAYIAVFEDGKQIDTMYPGEVGLPQARERGRDDRGRHPAHARRGSLSSCCAPDDRLGTQTDQPADRRQPAGQLDLARLRHAGARHRHRAAAGADVLVRARRSCRSRRRPRRDDRAGAVADRSLLGGGPTPVRPDAGGCTSPIRTSRSSPCAQPTSRRSCSTRSSASAAPAAHELASAASAPAARRTRCAASSRALIDQGKNARRDHPALHHAVRQPGDARRAARQGLQPPGLARSLPARRRRRGRRRLRRPRVVAPARRNGGRSRAPADPALDERLDDELRNLD